MNSNEGDEKVDRREEANDFVKDALYVRGRREAQFKKFNSLEQWEQNNWEVFHWSTRSKLEASIWFYSQLVGLAGVRHVWFTTVRFDSVLNWHVDAFFNELVSAFETLLQEINVVHRCGLKVDEVTWQGRKDAAGIRDCLEGKATKTREYVEKQYCEKTFKEIRDWRNTAFHHHHIPKVSTDVGFGEVVRAETTVELVKSPSDPAEKVELKELVHYIEYVAQLCSQVWQQLAEEH